MNTVRSAYRRTGYSSIRVLLDDAATFAAFKASLLRSPIVSMSAQSEKDYYESRSKPVSDLLFIVGYVIGGIMSLGALFGALNTMYAAISARTREIATLRAIGFSPLGIVSSVMVEALALSLTGGLIGAAIAWLLFDGNRGSTYSDEGVQIVFPVLVDATAVTTGLLVALAIGVLGGVIPAMRAARRPIAEAIRRM